jgi:hypothetical protein
VQYNSCFVPSYSTGICDCNLTSQHWSTVQNSAVQYGMVVNLVLNLGCSTVQYIMTAGSLPQIRKIDEAKGLLLSF